MNGVWSTYAKRVMTDNFYSSQDFFCAIRSRQESEIVETMTHSYLVTKANIVFEYKGQKIFTVKTQESYLTMLLSAFFLSDVRAEFKMLRSGLKCHNIPLFHQILRCLFTPAPVQNLWK